MLRVTTNLCVTEFGFHFDMFYHLPFVIFVMETRQLLQVNVTGKIALDEK